MSPFLILSIKADDLNSDFIFILWLNTLFSYLFLKVFKIILQTLFHSISTKLLPVPNSSLLSFFLPSSFLSVNEFRSEISDCIQTKQHYKTFKGTRLVSPILFLSVSLCFLFQVLPTIFFSKKKVIFPFVLLLLMLGPVHVSSDQQYSYTTVICILFHFNSFLSCCLLPFWWLFISHPAVLFPFLSCQS